MDVRLDKWLWAARLAKTRALAAEAIDGGHVLVGGARVKRSRPARVGDVVLVRGPVTREVVVRALSDRRGPASVAALLYDETPASVEAREAAAAARRLERPPLAGPGGRPTKRDRRRYERTRRGR